MIPKRVTPLSLSESRFPPKKRLMDTVSSIAVGASVGVAIGAADGLRVVGSIVGAALSVNEGLCVGENDGDPDNPVGDEVGKVDGPSVAGCIVTGVGCRCCPVGGVVGAKVKETTLGASVVPDVVVVPLGLMVTIVGEIVGALLSVGLNVVGTAVADDAVGISLGLRDNGLNDGGVVGNRFGISVGEKVTVENGSVVGVSLGLAENGLDGGTVVVGNREGMSVGESVVCAVVVGNDVGLLLGLDDGALVGDGVVGAIVVGTLVAGVSVEM